MTSTITNTNTAETTTTTTTTTIQRHGVSLPLLTEDATTWYQSSLVTVQQITNTGLQLLLQTSYSMQQLVQKNQKKTKKKVKPNDTDVSLLNALSNQVIGTIFYEASTRTSCSFQTATLRLNGTYIHIDGMGNTSTGKKGETLSDTIRCIQCYTDAIVLRHPVTGSIYTILQQQQQQQQSETPTKPIINAGDGIGEHPTQALLDVYTMYTEYIIHRCQYQVPSTFTVVMLGDLKHGRTVHSLIQLLMTSTHNILYTDQLIIRCCAPNDTLQLPADILSNNSGSSSTTNTKSTVQIEYYTDPLLACRDANVLYVTRIQRERFQSDEDYNTVKGSYVVNMEFLNTVAASSTTSSDSNSNNQMIVLHPLPRVDEISTDIDHDPRAVYFQQMEYGMYVRMAILYLILHRQQEDEDEKVVVN